MNPQVKKNIKLKANRLTKMFKNYSGKKHKSDARYNNEYYYWDANFKKLVADNATAINFTYQKILGMTDSQKASLFKKVGFRDLRHVAWGIKAGHIAYVRKLIYAMFKEKLDFEDFTTAELIQKLKEGH